MGRSFVWVLGLMFSGTAQAACGWEGSASNFFRCLMDSSEEVDDNADRLDGVEAAVWDLSDALLTSGDVLSTVAGEGYALWVDIAPVGLTGLFVDLEGIPEGLMDGDDDTVGRLVCSEGQVAVFDGGGWVCGARDAMTEVEIGALVEDEVGDLRDRLEVLEDGEGGGASPTVMYGNYLIQNSVDLANLSRFTEIDGTLVIDAGVMPNVNGLEGLVTITGDLEIRNNEELMDVDGLSGLTTVEGHILIENNDALENMEGLSSITGEVTFIQIQFNPLLTAIRLPNITAASQYFRIDDNDALLEVDAGELVSIAQDFYVYGNDSLPDLSGLSRLESILMNLYIERNISLTHIGLDALMELEGTVTITDNDVLCESIVDLFVEGLDASGWWYGNDDGC